MVDRVALEKRYIRKGIRGSNPLSSALVRGKFHSSPPVNKFYEHRSQTIYSRRKRRFYFPGRKKILKKGIRPVIPDMRKKSGDDHRAVVEVLPAFRLVGDNSFQVGGQKKIDPDQNVQGL